MPCLNLCINVNLDGIDFDPIFADLSKCVSTITGTPEDFVMVMLNGADIQFGKSKEPAAFGEVVAMGGIDSVVKRRLINEIGAILKTQFNIPKTRFVLKVFDTTLGRKLNSKL